MNQQFSTAARIFSVALMAAVVGACATKVDRRDPGEQIDISGKWNDTDSQLVSKEMITDALSRPWLNDFVRDNGRQPVVIVGSVRNLSHEHINTRTFVADMERELTNSGKVQFVADKNDRNEVRDERADQAVNATAQSQNAARQELGADFMLQGQINTIQDLEDPKIYIYKDSLTYYQVDLTLVSLKDNRKVWLGQKKIKKFIKKPLIR